MADTFKKKSLEQKRAKKKQDKLERKSERKTNNNKGKSLDDMITYIDENGDWTNVPPSMQNRKKINAEDIPLESTMILENKEYVGTIDLFFSDKAYGFIAEENSVERIFVHSKSLVDKAQVNDKVSYQKEKTPKGFVAINVKKINF